MVHTPDTLGTLPDIAANACPLRVCLKCRTITTHARKSVVDLSRNCKGFRARESVHACVTESRAQGRVFLLIYGWVIVPSDLARSAQIIVTVWFTERQPIGLCVRDLRPRGKGNSRLTKLFGGLSYENILRYNNLSPCVTARWPPQQIPP